MLTLIDREHYVLFILGKIGRLGKMEEGGVGWRNVHMGEMLGGGGGRG